MPLKLAPALRYRDASFEQNGSQLINQCSALAHQSIAPPVQGLHVELPLPLQLDKPHRRSGCRLRNRFRIAIVRRHQPDLVTLSPKDAAEMVCPAAGLHRHHGRPQLSPKLDHSFAAHASPQHNGSAVIQ
jgi:hypothetical protein